MCTLVLSLWLNSISLLWLSVLPTWPNDILPCCSPVQPPTCLAALLACCPLSSMLNSLFSQWPIALFTCSPLALACCPSGPQPTSPAAHCSIAFLHTWPTAHSPHCLIDLLPFWPAAHLAHCPTVTLLNCLITICLVAHLTSCLLASLPFAVLPTWLGANLSCCPPGLRPTFQLALLPTCFVAHLPNCQPTHYMPTCLASYLPGVNFTNHLVQSAKVPA
jgi:hypothetical protein